MVSERCNGLTNTKKITNALNTIFNVNSTCKEQILEYLSGLKSKSKWALSMFDSGAIPPSNGQLINYGNFDECLNVRYDKGQSDLKGKYCLGSLLNTTSSSVLNYSNYDQNTHLAACVPNNCSAVDAEKFFSIIGFDLNFDESHCQTKTQLQFTTTMVIALLVYGTIITVVLGSTLHDFLRTKKESPNTLINKLSIRTNYNKIFSQASQNEILCLHGMKAISVFGVILCHVYLNSTFFYVTNPGALAKWPHEFLGAITLAAGFPIITFFVISGFLTGNSCMKYWKRKEEFKIGKYYLSRYLRLTPPLAVVVLYYVSFLPVMSSGPLWPTTVIPNLVTICYEKWWQVILYIQNVVTYKYCVMQSWFLDLDMQYYLLSPLLVYVLKKKEAIFLKSIISVTVACFFYTVFVVLFYQPTDQIRSIADPVNLFFKYSLIVNAPSWLIGYGLSYVVAQRANEDLHIINKVWVVILWLLSISIIFVWIYVNSILSIGDVYKGSLLSSVFWSCYQITWSLAIAWMIFACIFHHGGFINDFLSLPLFQVISKLSYSMYLVHYVIDYTILAASRYPITISYLGTFYVYCITLVITLCLSLLLSLFVELPSLALSAHFLKKNKKENRNESLVVDENVEKLPLLKNTQKREGIVKCVR